MTSNGDFGESAKVRIISRAGTREQRTTNWGMQGDGEAAEMIEALRRVAMTPDLCKRTRNKSKEKDIAEKLLAQLQPEESISETISTDTRSVTPLPRMRHANPRPKYSPTPPRRTLGLSLGFDTLSSLSQRISAKHIADLRTEKTALGKADEKACAGLLTLLAEVDQRIDVTTSFQVMKSCSWETMKNYTQKPGLVVGMIRQTPLLILTNRISDAAFTRMKSTLGVSKPRSDSHWSLIHQFLMAAIDLHESKKTASAASLKCFLERAETCKSPLSSNQSTHRVSRDLSPNASFSPLQQSRSTESVRLKKGVSVPTAKLSEKALIPEVKAARWKMDDYFRDFLRGKMLQSPDSFLSEVEDNIENLVQEFVQKVSGFIDTLPEEARRCAVLPFLRTIAQGDVIREVAQIEYTLCFPSAE